MKFALEFHFKLKFAKTAEDDCDFFLKNENFSSKWVIRPWTAFAQYWIW